MRKIGWTVMLALAVGVVLANEQEPASLCEERLDELGFTLMAQDDYIEELHAEIDELRAQLGEQQ